MSDKSNESQNKFSFDSCLGSSSIESWTNLSDDLKKIKLENLPEAGGIALLSGVEKRSETTEHKQSHAPAPPPLRRGASKSEYQRNNCLECKKSTRHIVFTHSVHCCDRTNRNQQTFAISKCCECNTEHSSCRECCKKAKAISPANHAACLRKMYKWTNNFKSDTKYSLKCDVCNTGYVLCNYCQALYKRFHGQKGKHTKDKCKLLQSLKGLKAKNNKNIPSAISEKRCRSPSANPTSRPPNKAPCTRLGMEAHTAEATAATATHPYNVNVNMVMAARLDAMAKEMVAQAMARAQELTYLAAHLRSQK